MMNFLNHSKWASVPYTGVDAIFNVNRFLPSKLRVESRVCSEGCTVVYLEWDHSSGEIFHNFQWKEETSPIKHRLNMAA